MTGEPRDRFRLQPGDVLLTEGGDDVAPFMASPDTDPAALRAADSLEILPDDPVAAAEEIQRRREELGFSYFVFGAEVSDSLAPVVAKLAGT
jgi:hypothetical protein